MTAISGEWPVLTGTETVVGRILARAAERPDDLAVSDGKDRLTYAELDQRSRAWADRLSAMGAGPEACVGLLIERSVDFAVAASAVMRAGAAYLPLDPGTPADRVGYILTDASAPLLLADTKLAAVVPPGPWRTVGTECMADLACAATESGQTSEPQTDGLAYVIYTSGSTGRPKGVEITHANLANLIDWHHAAFDLGLGDRVSQVAGLGFDAAVWEIWPALAAGASLHFAPESVRRSGRALRDWLLAERITTAFAPTLLAEQLLHAEWPADCALRTLLTGADVLHRRPPIGLPFTLVNNYGPTECTVVATSGAVPATGGDDLPSIGRPIANTEALILDDHLRPVPAGEPGELCLAGAHVGRGYRNNPQLTAEKFVTYTPPDGTPARVYRTGDRAKLLPSGEIAFLGRLDEQVKIRGYRIELGEIVSWLDRSPSVSAAAATVRDLGDGGPSLVAYVVPAAGASPTALALREFLAGHLPEYMLPAQFVALPALPTTANGKLDKAALPEPGPENLLSGGESDAKPAAATTKNEGVESRVGAIVASLLNLPAVAPDANFFMLGGHSMLGVQLVAKLRDTFGVKLTLRQLFTAPTVAALSAEVTRLLATN